MTELPQSPDGWAFFLDLDGTLVDIAPTPEAIVIPPELPGLLVRLGERTGGACAVVTGRTIDTIDRVLAPLRLPVAGVHGAEIRLANGRRIADPALSALAPARAALTDLTRRHPALFLEDKGVALTVHYRADPGLAGVVAEAARRAVAADEGLAVQHGKMVVEVRPAHADKGRAVETLMAAPPFRGRKPLAAGDDLTDEHMFRAAAGLGGSGVRVGTDDRVSEAQARLPDPASMRAWLARLVRGKARISAEIA